MEQLSRIYYDLNVSDLLLISSDITKVVVGVHGSVFGAISVSSFTRRGVPRTFRDLCRCATQSQRLCLQHVDADARSRCRLTKASGSGTGAFWFASRWLPVPFGQLLRVRRPCAEQTNYERLRVS